MRSGLEDYFRQVLLCDRFRGNLCYEAARRGHVGTLKWARVHGCRWNTWTCSAAAKLNLQVKNMNLSTRGSLLATLHPGSHGPRIRRPRGRPI
jgi:hypothetical protein